MGIGTTSPNMKFNVGATGGSSTSWSDKSGITNSTTDRSIFMSMYNGNAVLAVHNVALNAWHDLYINTVDGTTGMVVEGNGNVGIGTTSPAKKLHLYDAAAGDVALKIETSSGGDPTLYLTSQTANRSGIISFQDNGVNAGRIIYSHNGDNMDFYTVGIGASHLELSLNETAGAVFRTKVGIGVTDPDESLEVAGNIKIEGATPGTQSLIINGGLTSTYGISLQYAGVPRAVFDFYPAGGEIRIGGITTGDEFPVIYSDGVASLTFGLGATPSATFAGNVGIGADSPSAKLSLYHATDDVSINVNTGTGGSYPKKTGISFGATSTSYGSAAFTGGAGIQAINTAASGNPTDLTFWTNSTGTPVERMRIDSAGNVGIGTDSPDLTGFGYTTLTVVGGTTPGYAGVLELGSPTTNANGQNLGIIAFMDGSTRNAQIDVSRDTSTSTANMIFYTNSGSGIAERMRITSPGFLKASNYGGYFSTVGSYHELVSNATGNWLLHMYDSAADPYGIRLKYSASPNNAHEIFYFDDGTQQRYYVTSAGAVYGNGTYGTISDIKLKENIVDATPKLDDINKLKVRNFNFKDKPEEKHIGFIAQELEEVFPKAIENTQDRDDDGKLIEDSYTKTIKSSILIPMLVKSIQELKAEIDILKNK